MAMKSVGKKVFTIIYYFVVLVKYYQQLKVAVANVKKIS